MTHHFQKGIESVRKVGMTDAQKKLMLERVLHAPAAPVESPWSLYSFRAFYLRHSRVTVSVACGLALMLSISNVAFAAHGSLPGDLLYPVKTKILEPVQGALAVTPAARANFHAQVAETRIEEAQALAAEGRLNADNAKDLEDSFHGHAAAFAAASTSAALKASFHADIEARASQLEKHGSSASAAARLIQSVRADIGDQNGGRGDSKPSAPANRGGSKKSHNGGDSQHSESAASTSAVSASVSATSSVGAQVSATTSVSAPASPSVQIPTPPGIPAQQLLPSASDSFDAAGNGLKVGHDKIGL